MAPPGANPPNLPTRCNSHKSISVDRLSVKRLAYEAASGFVSEVYPLLSGKVHSYSARVPLSKTIP
jgi:hypothetical protein